MRLPASAFKVNHDRHGPYHVAVVSVQRGAARMNAVTDLLAAAGIKLAAYTPGQHSTICPKCSAKRTKAHQGTKCLGVKIDADGVCWRCNHCDWSGPEKGNGNGNGAGGEFAATYDYPGFQKVRYPKGHEPRFRIRHRTGGHWAWGAGGADTGVLYRKDEVDEAIANGHEIVCCEGEKDVDRLWSIGIPATCNAHGAADPGKNQKPKWKAEHSEQLRGAPILVIPDHDNAGYAHADATCKLSQGTAKRVRLLKLADHWPECPKGGDVSDWLDAGHTREELDALIATAPDYQANAGIESPQQPSPNAVELRKMAFPPIKYVVPGIIVEGLTLLAGKPKIGKSWLLLHAAIAVARGGFTLGDIHCIEGDVLYCALEDNLRRLQSRMFKLMGTTQSWPERLRFKCEMPRLTDGGLDVIKDWIAGVKQPRLIIIDTLAMVRAPTKKKEQTQYDADYTAVLELRTLANEHGLAVVVVHHLRKADADDAFDTVSGTLGLTGAVDTMLILKRDTSGTIVMHGRGRDLVDVEKAMSFDINACIWRIEGDAAELRRSAERQAVLNAIAEAAEPIGPRDIATMTGMRTTNVRFLLGKLAKEGAIEKASYGKYRSPRPPSVSARGAS
jgi:AAA domain-containing protein/IclR-like helix-turn-helix domain-containing protein